MKKLSKNISVFLSIILLVSSVSMIAFAEKQEPTITSFSITPFSTIEKAGKEPINWFKQGDTYFMFLPSDTDLSLSYISFEATDSIFCNETELVSNTLNTVFTELGNYTLTCGEKSYSLTFMMSANIPSVFIHTESGSLNYIHANKENKEKGTICIYQNGEEYLSKDLKQIKGRGNTTWNEPKKPYNIKFDKKQNLFGMGSAKKWTLLASYKYDNSLLKNRTMYNLGLDMGLDETSNSVHIDLYINGNYMGNYLLCESVEIGETRVTSSKNDLDSANEDANKDIDDLSTLAKKGT